MTMGGQFDTTLGHLGDSIQEAIDVFNVFTFSLWTFAILFAICPEIYSDESFEGTALQCIAQRLAILMIAMTIALMFTTGLHHIFSLQYKKRVATKEEANAVVRAAERLERAAMEEQKAKDRAEEQKIKAAEREARNKKKAEEREALYRLRHERMMQEIAFKEQHRMNLHLRQ